MDFLFSAFKILVSIIFASLSVILLVLTFRAQEIKEILLLIEEKSQEKADELVNYYSYLLTAKEFLDPRPSFWFVDIAQTVTEHIPQLQSSTNFKSFSKLFDIQKPIIEIINKIRR